MLDTPQNLIINHRDISPPLRRELLQRGLILFDENWTPDPAELNNTIGCYVWFYDCLRHPIQTWRLKRRLASCNVPLVAWNRDAPHYLNRSAWRLDWLNWARLLDIYASHSLIDQRRFADNVLYLPNAADIVSYSLGGETEAVFSRLRDPANYHYDVSFFGGMNGRRYKEDADRERFFSAIGERLSVRGIRFLFREAEGMSAVEQIDLIQTSRISLNYGARCEYLAPTASGLPERCYGIPACGGFLLCDKRTHARDDFTVGENWAEFDGLDDCIAKIEFWLTHFSLARDLAERCHRHVMCHHTYANRAATLHQALLAWHAQHRNC